MLRRLMVLLLLSSATACGDEGGAASGRGWRDSGTSGDKDDVPAVGTLGGTCYGNGTCNATLVCRDDDKECDWNFLDARNAGYEGGLCVTNAAPCGDQPCQGGCSSGLECVGGVCGGPPLSGVGLSIDRDGRELRFGWTSKASAALLAVVRDDDPINPIWGLRSQTGIRPPVVFGTVPAGVDEVLRQEAKLVQGTVYRVVMVDHSFGHGAGTYSKVFTF